ncbi:hypothetical protein [Kutzneria sp. CA-103260]|uniref:hypothetical protein n=1 Tax=Kutzneria sp. CA-103260 TaxID=2802641 RepID=UPI001BA952B0|nr:hypothetical protein [Kutzneria sp. CA-103260]QUQ69779.1 hypothetical protein JJ691_75410 [Kutzneria sp. CA-103260]
MNASELASCLPLLGVPDRMVVAGGSAEFAFCVDQDEEDGVWEVYYLERGQKNDLLRFASEHQACCYMLGRLAYSQILAGHRWGDTP